MIQIKFCAWAWSIFRGWFLLVGLMTSIFVSALGGWEGFENILLAALALFLLKRINQRLKWFSYKEINLVTPKRKVPINVVAPMAIPIIFPSDNNAKKWFFTQLNTYKNLLELLELICILLGQ